MTNECALFTQTCCRNAVRDARLTVHLTQLQVFLVLQFGPPSVSDVLLVSLNSLNPISSARSFKMPAANRECPSSAQCKLPARGRRATTPTLAIQASHLPFNSSDTYHAPHTSRRHDSYQSPSIMKRHAHIGPHLVVVLVLFLFLSFPFRPSSRLFFPARKSQCNCHFFRDVLFSNRIQCIQRPLPPFLAKNERPGDGPTSLKLHSFYFWLWASLSFHSFRGPRKQGWRGGRRGRLCCFSIPFLPINVVPLIPRHIRPPG